MLTAPTNYLFTTIRSIWFAIAAAILLAAVDQWRLYQSIADLNTWTNDMYLLMPFQFIALAGGIFLSIFGITHTGLKNRGLLLFLAAGLLFAYWLPLGFDITDEGRRMSFSYFFMESYRFHLVDFKFGSHYITYLWLHLISAPSVMWMRIGFLLCKSAFVVMMYKLLRMYFASNYAFLGALVGGIVSVIFADQVLDYNNIPSLLVLTSLLCVEYSLQKTGRNRNLTLVFAGAVMAAAFLSKFPIIATLPVLIIYIALKYNVVQDIRTRLRLIAWFLVGFISVYLCFLGVLWINDLTAVYFHKIQTVLIEPFLLGNKNEAVQKLAEHGHDPDSIKSKYLSHLIQVRDKVWLYLLAGLPIMALWQSTRKWLLNLLWLCYAIVIAVNFSGDDWMIEFISITLSLFVIAIRSSQRSDIHVMLLFTALVLIIGLFIGTNNGFLNLYITGGLALLASISIATIFHFGRNHIVGSMSIVLLLTFLAWNTKSSTIYRNLDQAYLTSAFETPSLLGIYATQNRVMLMDSTMTALQNIVHEEDNLLCVNTVPGFNYLLHVEHSGLLFWRLSDLNESEKIQMLNSEKAPKHLLVSKIDTRLRYWPNLKQRPYSPQDSVAYTFYDSYLHSGSAPYESSYSNPGFELWSKRKP